METHFLKRSESICPQISLLARAVELFLSPEEYERLLQLGERVVEGSPVYHDLLTSVEQREALLYAALSQLPGKIRKVLLDWMSKLSPEDMSVDFQD